MHDPKKGSQVLHSPHTVRFTQGSRVNSQVSRNSSRWLNTLDEPRNLSIEIEYLPVLDLSLFLNEHFHNDCQLSSISSPLA